MCALQNYKFIDFPLRAPGDVTITEINTDPDDTVKKRTEYFIAFSLCKDVHDHFDHILKFLRPNSLMSPP